MANATRRYDIDWLRVIAIGMLLIYHIGIGFQPWGVFIGFIQNDTPLESLWVPMSMLNIWRIPLLFLVSGMSVCFALEKRSWKQLIVERTRRILLPFVFGALCIVPLHVFVWQRYYRQDQLYESGPVHLWFLANIFIYVLLLVPLFVYLKKYPNGQFSYRIEKLFSGPLGLVVMFVAFIVEVELLHPDTFALYAMTAHGFFLGLLAFLFGFLFLHAGKGFRNYLGRSWRFMLVLAFSMFLIRWMYFELEAPLLLMSIESNLWVLAILGFADKYLHRPRKVLSYLGKAAYPVYIVHMVFLYLGAYLIFPLNIPATLKLGLQALFTFAGCLLFYEFVVRRIRFLRPWFGIKQRARIDVMVQLDNLDDAD